MVEISDTNFEQEVLGSTIPVVVDFWAEWCGPCRHIMPFVHELADTFEGKIKVASVNVDECPEVAERYGIMTIPTLLFIKGGEVQNKHVGALTKPMLQQKFEALL